MAFLKRGRVALRERTDLLRLHHALLVFWLCIRLGVFLRRHALIPVGHELREERQQVLLILLDEVDAAFLRYTCRPLHFLPLATIFLNGLFV